MSLMTGWSDGINFKTLASSIKELFADISKD